MYWTHKGHKFIRHYTCSSILYSKTYSSRKRKQLAREVMEDTTTLYSSLSILLLLLAFKFLFLSKKRNKNLPPSPRSLPIIGHLHLLKQPVHRYFQSLSQKYGPTLSLRFGSQLVVVVSSASVAEECFTKNDVILANRRKSISGKHLQYDCTTMSSSSYGDHWRNLRRIGAIEIFSSSRLNASLSIRKDEVRRLLLKLSRTSGRGFVKVELRPMFLDLTFNNIMRTGAGKRYYGGEVSNEEEAKQFKELIVEVVSAAVVSNMGDFLPILNWVGNYKKKLMRLGQRLDGFLQGLIDEHRNREQGNTMIDHLLSLQESEPEYYTDNIIKGLMLVMVFGGTDTVSVTLEWAMANLLNHPAALKKAREEIDAQVGKEKLVDEPDFAKLPYLQNIVWETLRLYPAAPLLVPHTSSADCTIGGYDVPCGAMLFVNVWAIHREADLWDDPESFKPERFEREGRESLGLLPFGSGRRACPGAGLAQRLLSLTLGLLIQCFEWERVSDRDIDMSESGEIILRKAEPLEGMCKVRPIVDKLLYGIA